MLIAGCPASNRDWVIKHWVAHLKRAFDYVDETPYVFCVVPEYDERTARALQESCSSHGVELYLHREPEPERADVRDWNTARFEHMAYLRNIMLEKIRLLEPDLFLSIDSDILIERTVLANLCDAVRDYDAVGGKVWLSPRRVDGSGAQDDSPFSRNTLNYAMLNRQGTMVRRDFDGVHKVDILMALKLMNPDAYWIDYSPSSQGEDIGWSTNAKERGLVLGWDGRVASKHIMHPDDLHHIDERVGW